MVYLFVRTAFAAAALCAATAALAEAAAPANVAKTSKGAAFVNGNGMSLYTFDKDEGGKSACYGPCAAIWPPFVAPSGASTSAEWTIVKRDDGSTQWAYKGQPLYTFAKDGNPGDANGDGFKNIWHVAKP
jgi:predicted lipoprotein with Yx(FWY)xxD motif